MSKERLQHPRLRGSDILRLAGTGLRARPMRAFLSALGIAIGIAAMIAVVGISTSSRAQLTAQLESLGTNMLTVTKRQICPSGCTRFAAGHFPGCYRRSRKRGELEQAVKARYFHESDSIASG